MTGLTETLGSARFVLFGVCSGADNAVATALVDDRVAAIVLVDPPAYPTRRSQLRDLQIRVAERGSLKEAIRWGARVAERRLRLAIAMLGRRSAEDPPSEGRELPPVATFGARLTALVDRGVRILAVYSGIHGPRYNHPDQLFEVFPALRGRVDHRYYPTANHTFTERAVQAELIDDVTAWTTATANRFG